MASAVTYYALYEPWEIVESESLSEVEDTIDISDMENAESNELSENVETSSDIIDELNDEVSFEDETNNAETFSDLIEDFNEKISLLEDELEIGKETDIDALDSMDGFVEIDESVEVPFTDEEPDFVTSHIDEEYPTVFSTEGGFTDMADTSLEITSLVDAA